MSVLGRAQSNIVTHAPSLLATPSAGGASRLEGVASMERFWSKVDRSGGPAACWPWTAYVDKAHGYGVFMVHPRQVKAHRMAYELAVGPIPEGLFIDHLCRNRSCVNPAHLEPVTAYENWRRGHAPQAKARRAGTCPNGHARTPENTRQAGNSVRCLDCRALSRQREDREKRRASNLAWYHRNKTRKREQTA